jgi:spore germination protein YaaH
MGRHTSNVLLAVALVVIGGLVAPASAEHLTTAKTAVTNADCASRAGGPGDTNRPPRFTAYLNAVDYERGLQDLSHEPALDAVSGQWLRFTTTGTLAGLPRAPNMTEAASIARRLHARRIKVFVTITNKNEQGEWDPELTRAILSHHRQVARVVARHAAAVGYDGVDLDIEKLEVEDMENYADFLGQLALRLQYHRKLLTVYLKPRHLTQDGGRHAARIAGYVDQIRLGTYNYQLSTNPPEPFAPYAAVERDLCEVLAYVPASKIAVGLTSKAVYWEIDESGQKVKDKPAHSRQWLDLRQRLPDETASNWDADARGTTFVTDVPGQTSQLRGWLEDGRSTRHKLLLAERYGVDAFLFRLGGSDPLIWTYVNQWVNGTLR